MGADRAYQLTLTPGPAGTRMVLSEKPPSDGGWFETRKAFAVAPGAGWLAYAVPKTAAVRIMAASGKELEVAQVGSGDFRFSADGRRLAFSRPVGGGGCCQREIGVLDLASGRERILATVDHGFDLQWVRDGVVVTTTQPVAGDPEEVVYLPLEGKPRVLVHEDGIDRVLAAANGVRVVIFDREGIEEVYTDEEGFPPTRIGRERRWVRNAEMAPDGSAIAYTIDQVGVYLMPREGKPVKLGMPGANSLWFSADSKRLLVATDTAAAKFEVATGKKTLRRFPGGIRTARLLQDGSGAVLAASDRVLLWKFDGTTSELAHAELDAAIEAADRFGDAVVVWSSRVTSR